MVEVHKVAMVVLLVAMVVHQVEGPLMVVQDPLSRLLEEAVGLRKVVVEGEGLHKVVMEEVELLKVELLKVAVEGEVHRGVVEVLQGAVEVLQVEVGDQWDQVQLRPMHRRLRHSARKPVIIGPTLLKNMQVSECCQ